MPWKEEWKQGKKSKCYTRGPEKHPVTTYSSAILHTINRKFRDISISFSFKVDSSKQKALDSLLNVFHSFHSNSTSSILFFFFLNFPKTRKSRTYLSSLIPAQVWTYRLSNSRSLYTRWWNFLLHLSFVTCMDTEDWRFASSFLKHTLLVKDLISTFFANKTGCNSILIISVLLLYQHVI